MGTDPLEPSLLKHTTVLEDVQRVRICFSGEVDILSSDLIEAAVADALRCHRPCHLEIDLTDVGFLDASGVRALLHSHTRAVEAGCRLAVTNPQPTPYRVMELTGVLTKLAVRPVAGDLVDG